MLFRYDKDFDALKIQNVKSGMGEPNSCVMGPDVKLSQPTARIKTGGWLGIHGYPTNLFSISELQNPPIYASEEHEARRVTGFADPKVLKGLVG